MKSRSKLFMIFLSVFLSQALLAGENIQCFGQWDNGFRGYVFQPGDLVDAKFPIILSELDFETIKNSILLPMAKTHLSQWFGHANLPGDLSFFPLRTQLIESDKVFIFGVKIAERRVRNGWVAVKFSGKQLKEIRTHLGFDARIMPHKLELTIATIAAKEKVELILQSTLEFVSEVPKHLKNQKPHELLYEFDKKSQQWRTAYVRLARVKADHSRYYLIAADAHSSELLSFQDVSIP